MDAIKHLRKPATGGSLISLALVLLLLVMTLVGLDTQQRLTRDIRTQVRIRERLRDLSRSLGQLDLLHLRYRATGMALFRAGCDQITDSVNLQLQDLQALVKHDPSRTGQLRLIAAGIDTVQRHWQSSDEHAAVTNARRLALEEEKRLDVVRSAAADFDELSGSQLKKLKLQQDRVMVQLRSWLVLLEILISVILLAVSLHSGLTRIRTSRAADHGGLPE